MYNHRIITAGIKEDILAICNYLKKDTEYYEDLRETVKKYDQKYQVFAAWLLARDIEPDAYIHSIQKYVDSKRITNFSVSKNAVKINDKIFAEPLDGPPVDNSKAIELTEYIHAEFPVLEVEQKVTETEPAEPIEDVPVSVSPDGSIRIFEINSANDGRRLVGDDTRWCIGYPGKDNMWQSYRDNHESTFFVVFDNNPPTPEQRKVAIDFVRGNQVLLTDIPNRTGTTLSNGMNWDAYSEYLTEKGIDLELTRNNPKTGEDEKIFTNKPMSEDERLQKATYKRISSLSVEDILVWQAGKIILPKNDRNIDYSKLEVLEDTGDLIMVKYPGAKYFTSRWLGLGKKVDDEVLVYLLKSVGGEDIVSKYVNTGLQIPESQYQIIRQNKSLLTTYLRGRINALQSYKCLDDNQFQDLLSLRRKDLVTLYFSKNLNFAEAQYDYLKTDRELLKFFIEKQINIINFNQDLLIALDDRDTILKFLDTNNALIQTKFADYIKNDKEFLLTYIKNVLTRNIPVQILPLHEMQDIVLETGDKELIKNVAQKRAFNFKHFIKAESIGLLDEVKYSIFSDFSHIKDDQIFIFYKIYKPFDVNLVSNVTQIPTLQTLAYVNPSWKENPRVSMASDIYNAQQIIKKEANYAYQKNFTEELIPNSPNQSLIMSIYSEGKFFTHFQAKDLSDENKDRFRQAFFEYEKAIKDLDFWKSFIKDFDAFEEYIKGPQNPLNFDPDDFSHVLKIIPSQFMNDQEIENFLKKYFKQIKYKDFVSNVNILDFPWLSEKYFLQFKYSNTLLKSELHQIIKNQDYQFAYKVLEETSKNHEVPTYIFSEIEVPNEVAIHILDILKKNVQDQELPYGGMLYHTKMMQNFVVNSTLGEQMYLLRNYPSFFTYQIKNSRDSTFIKPEVRAALKEMYPELAAKINDLEQRKYSLINDYYDEDAQEVLQVRRPSAPKVKEELPDPFAPDEDETTTAFVKSIIKVAQKLDSKKKYKLADKITFILGRYNV